MPFPTHLPVNQEENELTMMKRRTFLQGGLAGGLLAVAAGAGLLRPSRALAAQWPKAAFEARSIEAALQSLYGTGDAGESKAVTVKAPLQAENGAKVPVQILTDLPAESIDILVKDNAMPLAGRALLPNARGFFSTRIKMAKSSDIIAVVKANGKLHRAKLSVKVTVGGCGG